MISFQFPTLQTLGEELVTVLDFLHVKYVIGLGEGAGANVLARFGISSPSRVLGLILINCTGSAASVLENFKNKVFVLLYNIFSNPTFSLKANAVISKTFIISVVYSRFVLDLVDYILKFVTSQVKHHSVFVTFSL